MPVTFTAHQTVYFCPEERADVLTAILALLNAAQHTIRLSMFQLSHPDLIAALGAAHDRGVDVRIILDRNEAATPSEQKEIHALCLHVPPANIRVGTSPIKHRIMHDKLCVVDTLQIVDGSLNWSIPGFEECQQATITVSDVYAAAVEAEFDREWTFITTSESAYQHLAS